jgi:hypothetical protein
VWWWSRRQDQVANQQVANQQVANQQVANQQEVLISHLQEEQLNRIHL